MFKTFFITFLILLPSLLHAQLKQVPHEHVLSNNELINLLDTKNTELSKIKNSYADGNSEQALVELTIYFKEIFSKSYFFDWKEFENRFKDYNQTYSGKESYHQNIASLHLELYPASTEWKLPFKNLKNQDVTAYQYRHLARQHKADDIAFLYHYTKDIKYLNYIPAQAESLNNAFNKGMVENIKDGNGAYEAYRAANRMYNWLFAHQCLLASDEYTWQQQLTMIKTFLHTGAKLFHHNTKYHEGNHQTRGMSALAMLSIIFRDINGTDLWLKRSKNILEEHIKQEIYPDNFQFERSVHYHIADIKNYAFPYQIAQINGIELGELWNIKIKGLFDALAKLALPNAQAPVLQDDTDSPWAEFNSIDAIMAYGSALFNNQGFNYFASKKISSNDYWFLTSEQIENFEKVKKVKPTILSTEFPNTGYYIMRNGWDKDDLYMVISAGLSPEKPDHQHGDMLGIQAYAYGNMLLPNYQVRYYLPDFKYFKNSWVKNVALVDSILQGQSWTGNKGGSGFGKFQKLPTPKVIAWSKNSDIDVFIGEHDGFKEQGVNYKRQVLFIKDGFWIVKDQFESEKQQKSYQQIWQGHYTEELKGKHYRSVFPNGAGLEIVQLGNLAKNYQKSSFRGKGNLVLESEKTADFTYITLLFPFENFEKRLKETEQFDNFKLNNWKLRKSSTNKTEKDEYTDARVELTSKNRLLLLDVSYYKNNDRTLKILNNKSDLYLTIENNKWEVIICGFNQVELTINNKNKILQPGEKIEFNW